MRQIARNLVPLVDELRERKGAERVEVLGGLVAPGEGGFVGPALLKRSSSEAEASGQGEGEVLVGRRGVVRAAVGQWQFLH